MNDGRSSGLMKKPIVWALTALIVLLAAAGVLYGFLAPARLTVSEDIVIIRVDGVEYMRVPASSPQTITVRQDNGATNVIEVTGRGAVMQSSTCENQLCVHMGEVTVDNRTWRANGAFIICLPNRVSVELAVKED